MKCRECGSEETKVVIPEVYEKVKDPDTGEMVSQVNENNSMHFATEVCKSCETIQRFLSKQQYNKLPEVILYNQKNDRQFGGFEMPRRR